MARVRCFIGMTLLLVVGVGLTGCPALFGGGPVILQVSPGALDFGEKGQVLTIEVSKNATTRPMPALVASTTDAWVTIEACQSLEEYCSSSGPADIIRIPVRVDRNKMVLGPNTGSVVIQGDGVSPKTVAVYASNKMVADFVVDNRTPEVGEEVRFINRSIIPDDAGTVTGFEWDFGDGNTSSFNLNPTHAYTRVGTYTVKLTVTAGSRTVDFTLVDHITVSAVPPSADFTVNDTGFLGEPVQFTDTSRAGSVPVTGWLWDFGDGTTSSSQHPDHVYAAMGMYSVSLTVSDPHSSDRIVKDNVLVVREKIGPTAQFRVKTVNLLVNGFVVFENLSEAGTSPIISYLWRFGDGFVSAQENPVHAYSAPGTYAVTLAVKTAHGESTSAPIEVSPVTVSPKADFEAGQRRALTTERVAFQDTSAAGTSPIKTWLWNFGDPASGAANTAYTPNPSHVFSGPGTYTVSLAVTTSAGSDKMTKADYIDIHSPTPLDDYVNADDGSYRYERIESVTQPGYSVHVIRMVSQKWRKLTEVDSPYWEHWLTIIQPDVVDSATALLSISGGDNGDDPPDLYGGVLYPLVLLALESNSVVALLEQVPNQPLVFADEGFERSEDALISYTLDKYLDGGDAQWPALLPMTKSAIRAMDTVQDFLAPKPVASKAGVDDTFEPVPIDSFIVMGASKRGWTTWLTAAVDARVVGIAPLVFDALNMDVQMAHHHDVYGYYSEALQDYVVMDVFDRFDTPQGQSLLGFIDAYEYRARLKLPKLIVNSTGDEFFLPDSARFYLGDLPGDNRVAYMPNTNHGLGDYDKVVGTVLPWYQAQLDGAALPQYTCTIVEGEGRVVVESAVAPLEVNLWSAVSSNRDFRLNSLLNPTAPAWAAQAVAAAGTNRYVAQAPASADGWTGFFVEVKFESPYTYKWQPNPYTFSSQARVIPDTLPEYVVGLPEADFSASPTTPMLQGEVTFSDQSDGGPRPVFAWFWHFGDGATSFEQNPRHAYSALGRYSVALTVYTVHGTDTEVKPDFITIQGTPSNPIAQFTLNEPNPYVDEVVRFTDISQGVSSQIHTWQWDFGDGATSSEPNPVHAYAAAGTYDVSLTVISPHGQDTEVVENAVTVRPLSASANFTADTQAPSAFDPVSFQDLSTAAPGPITEWWWDFGDGVTSTLQHPVHGYTTAGTYTVSLMVTTALGADTETKTGFITVSAGVSPLEDYVNAPDPYYGQYTLYEKTVVESANGTYTLHRLNMTSQQWRSAAEVDKPVWRHWLTIVEPQTIRFHTGLLLIEGGNNGRFDPPNPPTIDEEFIDVALFTGTVLVHLHGVPSEPLRFTDETISRTEDQIIAYSYDKFMDSVKAGDPDPTWPVLGAMAKSAVCAMDVVQEYLVTGTGSPVVEKFVVSGGSKRGWTTWLTAVADPVPGRIAAIMPIVIDVLNMEKQMAHHRAVYGYWSPAIYSYAQMRVFERFGTPESDALLNIVDPYRRRDKLTMPKLIMNSSGDDFFVCDSSQFYFSQLPGENSLAYVPNTNHGLNSGPEVLETIAAYFLAIAANSSRPKYSWSFDGQNAIRARVTGTIEPDAVYLWQAYADPGITYPTDPNRGRRDFRLSTIGAAWQKSLLTKDTSGDYVGSVSIPKSGWKAFFIQMVFDTPSPIPGLDLPQFYLTTQVRVVPDAYPQFESYKTSVGTGEDILPVCVLYGTPYEMGHDLGQLMADDIQAFAPEFLALAQLADPERASDQNLDAAWNAMTPYLDQDFVDEIEGVAVGSGVDYDTLRRVHMIPAVADYSCSSVAAWGNATSDGRLYQSRNLDWSIEAGAHNYPCLTMYIPDVGVPHVNVGFAGLVGAHCGMNLGGIVLAEMGDAKDTGSGFDLNGEHFMPMFRRILNNALSLTEAIDILYEAPRVKKYHYVFGDGRNQLTAAKIRAHEPQPLRIWTDNGDAWTHHGTPWPNSGVPDENAALGWLFDDIVFRDEENGTVAGPLLDAVYGSITHTEMIAIANSIASSTSNVMNVVFDATGDTQFDGLHMDLWVSYATPTQQAYERAPGDYVPFNLQEYLP